METILIKGKEVPASWQISSDAIVPTHYCLHIICNSVHVGYRPLLVAAPQLFIALKDFYADVACGNLDSESMRVAGELIKELEATP